eukprot:TRINITY_DN4156_c0_g1_i1.p2 TRINITY_DN4156_c0_g1~~TRINITY_DN4156_c0_g1_i1.p2  ORF type:complete len:342 (+),score=132.63 TRINITY_DN4156_c0_g1_i1:77-1102(+)
MAMMKFDLAEDLEKLFKAERGADGKLRWIKIGIKDERIVSTGEGPRSDDAAADVEKLAASIEDPKQPFYAAVRYDGEDWCLLSYIPDDSMVKVRMLYAGSEVHVKQKLGNMVCTVRATEKSEVVWKDIEAAGKKATGGKTAPDPELMSEQERRYHEATKDGVVMATGGAPKMQFPMDKAAKEALEAFEKGEVNAVAFKLAPAKTEEIHLDEATVCKESMSIEDTVKKIDPKGESRYLLYRFAHEVDGEEKKSIVCLYYASSGTPIKRRMLYASTKATFVQHASAAGAAPDKVLEYPDLEEATTDALKDALKPAADAPEAAEEEEAPRPKPKPQAKGPRMLI